MAGTITIVGGGIGGLTAAIECAEGGADVRLLEARDSLGGTQFAEPTERPRLGGFAVRL